jgi:hypothetical protein
VRALAVGLVVSVSAVVVGGLILNVILGRVVRDDTPQDDDRWRQK